MTLEEDDKLTGDSSSATNNNNSSNSQMSKPPSNSSDNLVPPTTAEEEEEAASVAPKRSFDEIDLHPSNPKTKTESDSAVVAATEAAPLLSADDKTCDITEDSVMSQQLGASSISSEKSLEEEVPESKIDDEQITEVPVEPPLPLTPPPAEPITFNVVYAKESYQINMDLNQTISELKSEVATKTGVSSMQQKLCFKGILTDSKTLKQSGFKQGVKVLMIGSKMDDIIAVSSATKESVVKEIKEALPSKEPICQQKPHKKHIDKGIPEWSMPGWIGEHCDLPPEPLTGMMDKYGNKVRLTFKLELDEVWIGTKQRTQKLSISSIQSVVCEPIEYHPEYHMMAFQVGPTEASRIWFYWVPSQYVRAIKRAVSDY